MPWILTQVGITPTDQKFFALLERVLVPEHRGGFSSTDQSQYDKCYKECDRQLKRHWLVFTKEVLANLYSAFVTSGNAYTGGLLKNFHLSYKTPPLVGPSIVGGAECASFQDKGVFGMKVM